MAEYDLVASAILTIAFVFSLWHMDINHNLALLNVKLTKGIFKVSPETAFRLSQYGLISVLLLFNLLIILRR